jgi:hypothetical protein
LPVFSNSAVMITRGQAAAGTRSTSRPAQASISAPAMTKREAARKTGGTCCAPIFIGSQVRPQTRHISANRTALRDMRLRLAT